MVLPRPLPLAVAWTLVAGAGCSFLEFPDPSHRAGSGGSVSDSGTGGTSGASSACDGSRRFPSTPVLDNFDRADGAVGPNWIDTGNQFVIQGAAVASDDIGGSPLYWHVPFGAQQEVYATFVSFDPKVYDSSIAFASQGPSADCNWLHVKYSTSTFLLSLEQCVGTRNYHVVPINTDAVPVFSAGVAIGARLHADGCIEVFARAPQTASFVYLDSVKPPSPLTVPGGSIGLTCETTQSGAAGQPCVWDDFGGGDFAP